MNSIIPPIFPVVSFESTEVVGDAAREADDKQVGESVLPDSGAQAQVDVEDEGNGSAGGIQRRELPSSYMPSISEIRQHKTTHVPYRSWCDECVEAFAREWPHLHREGPNGRTIPVIHMDYACLTEKGLFKVDDLTEEERKHAVVAYCAGSRSPFMHVVPSKATSMDKFAAERIVEDIVYLGHTRVILRSDNEPALLLLVSDALKGLRVQQLDSAAAEGSVPHDPQTAGALVEHAFGRLTGVVGRDGRTAYNNIRGSDHTLRLPIQRQIP